jgi:TonB family protein
LASEAWKEWEGLVVGEDLPLLRLLGSADQSAVFLTRDPAAEASNAVIKLVRVDPAVGALQLSRWQRAARLSHPHLVRLFQTGVCRPDDPGLLYAVMEFGEENLADVLRDRPLTEAEAREMLAPALEALAYIHAAGFVHGRLKPANIMAFSDCVKISSDGICPMGESPGAGRAPGPYDPPELQAEGMSPAGDVWALGMTLVEALTQHRPVQPGPPLEPVLPETMPAEFLDICRDCLRISPGSRPSSADLSARLHPSPVPRPSIAVPESQDAGRPTPSRKWRLPLIVAALAVLALAAVVPRFFRQPAPPIDHSTIQPGPSPQPLESAPQPAATPTVQPVETAAPPPKVKGRATPGQAIHQVLPDVPRPARNTIHGTVRVAVRVRVNDSGRVTSARLDFAGPSRYLAERALDAARRWEFTPPQSQGRNLPSEWILRFELTRPATTVRPVRVSP